MNRIYKVIYSKARQCAMVVSELAKSCHKNSQQGADHTNTPALARMVAAVLAAGALTWGSVPGVSWAADITPGSGDGVAIGTGSNAPKAENVAIGKGAIISYSGGVGQPSTGDIVIGGGAHINNYIDQGGGIAIGANSFVENMTGGLERSFDFKQAGYKSFWGVPYGLPKDPTKMVTGVAIGQNTYARSGSIMLGTHNYKGNLGDVTVDSANTKAQNMSLFSTTLGANSYSNGLFSSVTGAYSIASSNYDGGENATKNFGATITGSLNSIESATSSNEYSGVANSIVGVANRTSNSNGSLIFGAGNEIQNSITDISAPTSGGDSAKALQDSLMKKVQRGNSGGATLVIGGGNKADYTQKTQILGVNNTVTGTEKNISDYNMIDGFGNTINGASHLYTIGTNNKITNTKNTILAGDDYTNVSGLTDSVIIGNNRVSGKDDNAAFAYFSNQKNIVSIGNKNVLDSTDGSISIGNNNFMWRSGGQPEKYGYDTGNVAIGNNTYINSYLNQGDSIVIGKNATAMNMGGSLEKAFAFGTPEGKDYSGSIAIGQNSYARSGSTMIGIHNYQGKLGDLDIDFTKGKSEGSSGIGNYQESIDATTIGNNSYNNGVFSTVVGSYTAVSGLYHNQKWGEKPYGVQNFGAAVLGSLNSVEGLTSTEHNTAGMADSILGSANRTKNANGTIMVGAGNVVEDSINDFDASEIKTKDGIASPNALSEAMRTSIKNANGGGAAAIVGNGNEVKKSTNVAVMGSKNSVTSTTNSQIFGDNRAVTGADGASIDGAVIIGSASGTTPMTTDKKNVTILGYNANATAEGGVALGADSVASVDKDVVGYDPLGTDHSGDTTGVWKSKAAVVSVGDKNLTRQITNVAAGKEDTDAVNVAQLKAAQTHFYSVNSTDATAGNYNNDGAKGKNSLAAGVGALANGSNSVAIGTKAKAQNDALAVGENANAGNNGIAIGMHANAGYGQNMALGYYASVANGVGNSTALGYGSQVTNRDILKSDGKDGVISVGISVGQSGEKGMTRRIINVKAGVNSNDAANVSQLTELKEGDHISIVDSTTPNEKGQTVKTISVKVDGQIAEGNKGILSGDTVYNEVHVDKDGNYFSIKSDNTVAGNLKALDGKVKTNADNIEKNSQLIEQNSARIDTNSKNIEKNAKAIEQNSARIDTNSKNIEKNAKAIEQNSARIDTNSKNIEKNSKAIEQNSARIDTNSQNIEKNAKAIEQNSSRIDTNSKNIEKNSKAIEQTSALVETNAKNIEKNGKAIEQNSARIDTNSQNIEKNAKAIEQNSSRIDTNSKNIEKNSKAIEQTSALVETNAKNIEKNGKAIEQNSARIDTNSRNIEKNGKNIEILQETKADTNLSNITDAGKTVINNISKKSVKVEAGSKNVIIEPSDVQDGPITYTVDIAKDLDVNTVKTKNLTVSNSASIGNITINQDGNGTISGLADTTIEQGSKNAVNAGTVYNETRVAKDGNFIRQANTAGENLTALDNQVTSNTQNINYLNGRVGELGDRINKVGAGAAALAALHPLDFDPDDKWDFAAGVGNYRNATAAAVGLFYRPNERTMFNLGWTMGDNRNMVNGGFSVKFGKSNKYVKYSKAEMASVIDNQSREIAELKAKDVQNAKDNAEMRAEIEALKKQVEALAAKK